MGDTLCSLLIREHQGSKECGGHSLPPSYEGSKSVGDTLCSLIRRGQRVSPILCFWTFRLDSISDFYSGFQYVYCLFGVSLLWFSALQLSVVFLGFLVCRDGQMFVAKKTMASKKSCCLT